MIDRNLGTGGRATPGANVREERDTGFSVVGADRFDYASSRVVDVNDRSGNILEGFNCFPLNGSLINTC